MKLRKTSAALAVLAMAGGLSFGAAIARADVNPGRCNDEPWGVGPDNDTFGDVHVGPADASVGVDTTVSTSSSSSAAVCYSSPDAEDDNVASVTAVDPSEPGPGMAVWAQQCPSDQAAKSASCTYTLSYTGANVDTPSVSSTTTGPTAGGDAKLGPNTCYSVNSLTPTCTGAVDVAGAQAAPGDVPQPNVRIECLYVGSTCSGVPTVTGASVESGDSSSNTADVVVVGEHHTADVPHDCTAHFGSPCP